MSLSQSVFSKVLFTLCVFLLFLSLCNCLRAEPASGMWQVGVASRIITPLDSMWLAGYAARDHAVEGTLQELWAKALAIVDHEGRRNVLVTTDLLGLPRNISVQIVDRCRQQFNLQRSQILLNSSHTHSGPVLRASLYDIYSLTDQHIEYVERYSATLVDDIVCVIGEALDKTVPAQLYSGNGVVRFQVNRRNNDAATLAAQSGLNGPNDYAVPVLQARRENGELMAVAFGYACHPTVLNGYEWCGDYPGYAQCVLEEQMPGVTALFFQGCGGDQNPLPRRSVALAQQYGRELAAAVQRVIAEKSPPLNGSITTGYTEIQLSLSAPPTMEQLETIAKGDNGYKMYWAKRLLRDLQEGKNLITSYPYPVQVWRIGPQVIIALGGEVVVDYAIQLKRIFGQDTFVLGYCNDVMAYIPSARVLREGGYEGATSQIVYGLPSTWRADIESRIIHTAIQLAGAAGAEIPESNILGE